MKINWQILITVLSTFTAYGCASSPSAERTDVALQKSVSVSISGYVEYGPNVPSRMKDSVDPTADIGIVAPSSSPWGPYLFNTTVCEAGGQDCKHAIIKAWSAYTATRQADGSIRLSGTLHSETSRAATIETGSADQISSSSRSAKLIEGVHYIGDYSDRREFSAILKPGKPVLVHGLYGLTLQLNLEK